MSYYPGQQPNYPPQQPYQQQGYGYQQPPPPAQHGHFQGQQPPPAGYPQAGYPPAQQAYYPGQQPPPPPGGHYPQHPPPGQYQQPPPQNFAPPPQHGYGAPPPGAYPPQSQYGAPGPAAFASPGYDLYQQAQGNMSNEATALRKAMKGMGTDEKVLINILTKLDPLQMKLLVNTYNAEQKRDLGKDVYSETSSHFRSTLVALIAGPLEQDVMNVREAVKGMGTKEAVLNDVLLARSNADLRAIKMEYQREFGRSMEADVLDDLSFKTKDLFKTVLAASRAEESAPVMPQNTQADVHQLQQAMKGIGTKEEIICSILATRSDGQIRAIAAAFKQASHKSLEDALKSEFSGHMQAALLVMVRRACDRAMSDAIEIEDTMAGAGTKDSLLLNRVVRIHWNRTHMDQVKRAYQHRYKRDLISRVKSETSSYYEKTLVACLE